MDLRISLTERLAVEANGTGLDERRFPGRQGRVVFAYLALQHGRPVPRGELAELLWGDELPATWEKALRVLMTKLRALLEECGIDGSMALTSAFGCYKLTLPDGAWIDVDAAAHAVARAEAALAAGELDEARAQATTAAALARRTFLPGEDAGWVEDRRRELEQTLVRALECQRDALFAAGELAEAARCAAEVTELEPFRESGYRRLMQVHAAAGNPAEALRVYEQCRRFLADELGAYPSAETESLYRELLNACPTDARGPARESVRISEVEHESHARGVSRALVVAAGGLLALGAAALALVLATRNDDAHATDVAANAVALVDAGGHRVRAQVEVGVAPTSVAVGHGAVWASNTRANTVSRINPETRTVRQTIVVGNGPSGLVATDDGVWVANHDDATLSWINPESNAVV